MARRKVKAKKYSEADQATALAALAANGGNVYQTARELGIPRTTLRKWQEGRGLSRDVAAKCQEKEEELSVLFERVARLYLGQALEKDVAGRASGKDAVIAAATATDKYRLLTGQSTSIHGQANLSDDERRRRIVVLLERAGLAGGGDAGGGPGPAPALEGRPLPPANGRGPEA